MIITSRLLDVPHGFTTRQGGVSQGPYASFNLSRSVGDDPAAVDQNALRLAAAAGLRGPVITARQVHGDRVLRPARPATDETLPAPSADADALWSADAGLAVGVKTADCVPILVHAPRSRSVAAVHAGWRGTVARVLARAIEALVREGGAAPGELRVAVGPAIGPCCFEVGPDVAAAFARGFPPEVVRQDGARTTVDLYLANRRIAEALGVPGTQIDDPVRCTRCAEREFFSHRRDRGVTGRHLAFIAPA